MCERKGQTCLSRLNSRDNVYQGKAYPFLVHELLVGTIINHTLSKYGCGELSIYLLSIQIGMFAVQNEIVALLTEIHSCRLSQENEGETISISGPAVEKEPIRIHAIHNCAPNEGENMEHDRWAVRVGKEQLPNDILSNGDSTDEYESQWNRLGQGKALKHSVERVHDRMAEGQQLEC